MSLKVRKFKLSEQFLEPFKTATVPWGPVGYITYKRTYARRLDEQEPGTEGTEEWWQTCRRVIEGMFYIQKQHCITNGLPWNDAKAQRTAKDAYERLFVGKWTPPGRGLWMCGTDFAENRTGAALFNCAFASTKDLNTKYASIFAWIMDALMLGVGVGFDTLGTGTLSIKEPVYTNETYVIPDTREGWVESTAIKLNGYFQGTEVPKIDYSELRGPNLPIKGFGGLSSGPQPLIDLHADIDKLFSSSIGQLITTAQIGDTANLIGKCVVAGNVRRSAELMIGQPSDDEFINLKQDLDALRSHRWCSNNSISAQVGMDYTKFAELSATNGEPGYIWLDNARHYGRMKDGERFDDLKVMGFNPCVEQQLEDREMCCLVEMFLARHDSFNDFLATAKIAYLYAKTITLAKTHWPETNQIMLKNRRIGLSVTGFVQACNKLGTRVCLDQLDQAYDYVNDLDSIYSDWLCIPKSKRRTSIKPSGTVSKLFGATPGAHYPEDEFYIQRIRFSADSNLLPELRKAGYHVEPCIYSPNTEVVSFPIQEPYFVKGKREVSMWEQLEIAAQLQHYWADNSVSVTITFKDHEAQDIATALKLYERRLKAVSFLRYQETGYAQAPMEPMTQEQYQEMVSKITPIQKFTFNDEATGTLFCSNDSCEIKF